jgi:glycosyltransferase involved in cell wall biosynthesis
MGVITDGARLVIRSVMAHLPRALTGLETARVVLVQNQETLARIDHLPSGRLLSNALAVELGGLPPPPGKRRREIVTSGRLIPLKGGVTAVRALSYVSDHDVRLVFIGDGPERKRIEHFAERLGLADRVEVLGWSPRAEVLARVRSAGVYLHTAVHDEASLSVAEALAQGTPVVGYDHGGPAEVMSNWPPELWTTVKASDPDTSARRLATACDRFLASPPPIPSEALRPARSFADALLDAYEEAVAT